MEFCGVNEMNGQEIIAVFLSLFPEYEEHYREHMREYGELLQYVFYAEVINNPLFNLLKRDRDAVKIKKYVDFIEHMWLQGDEAVQNVVDVTILECLSDNKAVWRCLGIYISEEFRDYINKELLSQNCAIAVCRGNMSALGL